MAKQQEDYRSLQAELDDILQELQQGEADVDKAMQRYERGLEIIKLLENRLTAAEHRIQKLQATHE